jgi:hypothetical protein
MVWALVSLKVLPAILPVTKYLNVVVAFKESVLLIFAAVSPSLYNLLSIVILLKAKSTEYLGSALTTSI